MGKFIKKYDMDFYSLSRDCFVSQLNKVSIDIDIDCINEENLEANKFFYPNRYKLWRGNLKKGAKGLFAIYGGRVVGYGWLKKKGSKDTFYRFGKDIAYLSEFYVEDSFRGKGIYPALLSQLILSSPEYHRYFISAYTSNVSSCKGLLKVGFERICSFTFIRAFKITFNKHKIIL